MKHADQMQLLDFVNGTLTDEVTMSLYAHLAECERCHIRAQALRALKTNFEIYWECWLDHCHAMVCGHVRSVSHEPGAATVSAKPAAVYEVAVRALLETGRGIAAIASQELREWTATAGRYRLIPERQYAGVADPDAFKEAEPLIEEGTRLLAAGQDDEARDILGQAATIDPHATECYQAKVLDDGGCKVLTIHVDAVHRRMTCLLHKRENMQGDWTVVVATPEGSILCETAFDRIPGAEYWLAEFEELPSGAFVVAVRRD